MRKFLLPENGQYYKANLHTHTTVSDGQMTPEETKAAYKAQGYAIVAMTDHEVLVPHTDLNDEDFLTITGYEVATNLIDDGIKNIHMSLMKKPVPGVSYFRFMKTCHLNLYSKDPNCSVSPVWHEKFNFSETTKKHVSAEQWKVAFDREYTTESLNALIAKANEEGFLVSYNHPVWSMQNYEDYAGYKGLWAIECHNSGCVNQGLPDTEQPFNDLLKLGQRVVPLATDDTHVPEDCFGGCTMVKAEKLDYGVIMQALERGDLYATTGPTIDQLYIENGVVHITCSAAKEIRLTTERRYSKRIKANDGETLMEWAIDISDYLCESTVEGMLHAPFFRLVIVDEKGAKAYTRAYFVDEL